MNSRPKKILIIDDNEDNYLVVKRLLRKEGYETLYAENGVLGLKMLHKEKIDLVLLDWMMPGMTGLEVCCEIKDSPKISLIPIVMLTARNSSEDIQQGLDVGADDYTVKPIVKEELLARVRSNLRAGELQRALDHQLKGVANIQRQLLPEQLPQSPDYQIETYYQPSDDSGGDYYDVIKVSDRYTAFIMADVCGHGAPSMVTMAVTRCYLQLLTHEEISPAKALRTLTHTLFKYLPTPQYVTMNYCVFDHEERKLKVATAGHPPPLVYKTNEKKAKSLELEPGFPLKLYEPEENYPECEVAIESGDCLLLFTDGYNEAVDVEGNQMGLEKMEEIVTNSSQKENSLHRIITDWHVHTDQAPQMDDVALLFVKF